MVEERSTFCIINASAEWSFSLDWPSHQHKMLWGLVMDEVVLFASVHWLKHTTCDTLSGVRRESVHGSYVVLHHHVTAVSRCGIFMVWETPNGLYRFLKQKGCSLSVCCKWHPSSGRFQRGHVQTACWVWNTCAWVVISCGMPPVISSFFHLLFLSWTIVLLFHFTSSPYSECWRRNSLCCHPSLTGGWNRCFYATCL